MTGLLLSREEKGIVVFKLWQGLDYQRRLYLSSGLILLGFLLQIATLSLFPGVIVLLAGNLFLLTSGYNNNVDVKGYRADQQWKTVTRETLKELKALDRRMKTWDRSFLDISNTLGFVSLVALVAILYFAYNHGQASDNLGLSLGSIDLGVLLVPHWLTGIRSILRRPGLMLKVDAFLDLEKRAQSFLGSDKMQFSLLVQERDSKEALPSDVRFRIQPKDAYKDFLGLQGQISLNNVQGKSYVYFYVVRVAKPGYGLWSYAQQQWTPPPNTVLEPSRSPGDDVEVLVIRQRTSKNSGYHTKPYAMLGILNGGYQLALTASKNPYEGTVGK